MRARSAALIPVVTLNTQAMAINRNNVASRFNLLGTVAYSLRDLETGLIVTSSEVTSFTGYSATGTTVAVQAAEAMEAEVMEVHFLMGVVRTQLGQLFEAAGSYERARDLCGGDRPITPQTTQWQNIVHNLVLVLLELDATTFWDGDRSEQQYECEVELPPARAADLAGPVAAALLRRIGAAWKTPYVEHVMKAGQGTAEELFAAAPRWLRQKWKSM